MSSVTDFRVLMLVHGVERPRKRRRFHRKGKCQRCGTARGRMTTDHIVPQCLLQEHPVVRNHFANKQTLCERCNNDKSDGPARDYRQDPFLHRELELLLHHHGIDVEVIYAKPLQ